MTNEQSAVYTAFETELTEVQAALLESADDLGRLLGELVRAQIKRASPPVRAAFILATAVNKPSTPQNETLLRAKRIQLAAGMEMLYVALHIHRLLVDAAAGERRAGDSDDIDRSFVGSTILAGDYCFSRAAQMAAATEDPTVVAIFSQALQRVSEGHLRHHFESGVQPLPAPFDAQEGTTNSGGQQSEHNTHEQPRINYAHEGDYPEKENDYNETHELLLSGAQAAAALARLNTGATEAAMASAQTLIAYLAAPSHLGNGASLRSLTTPTGVDGLVDPVHHRRRQALLTWLAAHFPNGSAKPPARYN